MTRVTIHLPAPLRSLAGGRSRLELSLPRGASSVGDALEALEAACPGIADRVLNEQGDLRPHVNVFVGAESIRWSGGLATPVGDGAEVSILPAVSGGVGE